LAYPSLRLLNKRSRTALAKSNLSTPSAGEPALCQECSERLWTSFLAPVVFYPLAAGEAGFASAGPPEPEGPGVRRMSTNNWTRSWLPPGGTATRHRQQAAATRT
jgi:hypothetical protein